MLSHRDYRAVFEASPDAMLIVDSDGVIRDVNRRAVSTFGWARGELEGSSLERLVPGAGLGSREHRGGASARPMGPRLELLAVRKDGTTIPVEIGLGASDLESGEGHVICAVRDISGWRRMRRLSGMMIAAAEHERRHLSHELHDEFLQSLVALKIGIKLLADERDDGARERARARIADEIHDAIRGVKRMIRGLLPPELHHRGLSSALGSVFRDIRDVYGFQVHARLGRVDAELEEAPALALYRIVREAVANAVRHARVSEAAVTLGSANGMVTATIRDDGCGFEMPGPEADLGDDWFGLAGMRERAALVGGTVVVRSTPGGGTTVRAAVPSRASAGRERKRDGEGW